MVETPDERMKTGVWAFVEHEAVPSTTNLAERDFRPIITKFKVAGCFRTIIGAEQYARINSFF